MNITLLTIGIVLIVIGFIIRSRQLAYSTQGIEEKGARQWKRQNRLLALYCQGLGVLTLLFAYLVRFQIWLMWLWFLLIILATVLFITKIQKNT